MKRLALIAAVVFTTITLQSCRQSDEIYSPEEKATLQKVQDPSSTSLNRNNANSINTEQVDNTSSVGDGELVPPPKK